MLDEIQTLQQTCGACNQAFGSIKDGSADPIRELIKQYAEKLSTFLKEHDTIHTETLSGDLKYIQVSIIIDYILFFDQK